MEGSEAARRAVSICLIPKYSNADGDAKCTRPMLALRREAVFGHASSAPLPLATPAWPISTTAVPDLQKER
jgi:hypothetical protein